MNVLVTGGAGYYVHIVDWRGHTSWLDNLDKSSAVYNLGCGGTGYSVKEVIDIAREVTGKEIPVKVGPRRPGDPAVLVASSEKIKGSGLVAPVSGTEIDRRVCVVVHSTSGEGRHSFEGGVIYRQSLGE